MLEVPVYNTGGEQVDTFRLDPARLGGTVNAALLKQAVLAYAANRRRGSAATKGRSDVAGSTRKLFRQKGTGYARRGATRTNILRGGGVAFAKRPGGFGKAMPKRMRRRALETAILAKILGNDLMVVDELKMDAPRTREMSGVLRNLRIDRSCVLAVGEYDRNVYLSARNIPDVAVRVAAELNAFDVATRQKMVATLAAMKALLDRET